MKVSSLAWSVSPSASVHQLEHDAFTWNWATLSSGAPEAINVTGLLYLLALITDYHWVYRIPSPIGPNWRATGKIRPKSGDFLPMDLRREKVVRKGWRFSLWGSVEDSQASFFNVCAWEVLHWKESAEWARVSPLISLRKTTFDLVFGLSHGSISRCDQHENFCCINLHYTSVSCFPHFETDAITLSRSLFQAFLKVPILKMMFSSDPIKFWSFLKRGTRNNEIEQTSWNEGAIHSTRGFNILFNLNKKTIFQNCTPHCGSMFGSNHEHSVLFHRI